MPILWRRGDKSGHKENAGIHCRKRNRKVQMNFPYSLVSLFFLEKGVNKEQFHKENVSRLKKESFSFW